MHEYQDKFQEKLAKIERAIAVMEIMQGVVPQMSFDAALVSLLAKQTSLLTKLRGPGANAHNHNIAMDESVRAEAGVHGTVIIGEGIIGDVVGRYGYE